MLDTLPFFLVIMHLLDSKKYSVTKITCGGDHSFLLYSNDQVCNYVYISVVFP